MVKLPQLRRSERETTPEERTNRTDRDAPPTRVDDRPEPAEPSRRTRRAARRAERNQSPAYSRKVEQAAERAAEATRTAAAAAAADRAHARARNSLLASLSLVLAVVAGLAVATGALAGLGVAVGVIALLLALVALAATARRHRFLAGRTEATVALLLALGAVVIGGLALAGSLSWLDTGTNYVQELRDQLPSWLT